MECFFPEEFDIDYEGQVREYQGISLLPHIDRDIITEKYLSLTQNEDLYPRNTIKQYSRFIYDEGSVCKYVGVYGM